MKNTLNRIFKVIWSKVQMTWVAVSELTKSNGKQQSLTRVKRTVTTAVIMMTGAAAIAAPPAVNQLPTQGQVAAGIAAIGVNGNAMTIHQSSDKAAINWSSFDIGSQASVNFVQPSASAIALNRVNASNPSQIYGQLNANGQVYLLNSSGVYFAPGASVNVGGIVATTHSMSDAAFLAGSTTFERNGATGAIINEGTIETRLNGYIAMLAPEVRNNGLLLAQSGTVVMAGAENIMLHFGADSKLASLSVSESQLDALVENRYAIKAPNGLVILSARAVNQLTASVINSGSIEAKGVSQRGGRIVLEASTAQNTGALDVSSDNAPAGTLQINGQNVSIEGSLVASSPVQGGTIQVQASQGQQVTNATLDASGGQGGQIALLGDDIRLDGHTHLNVSGATGGGTALVGGDWQGSNGTYQATTVYMGANTIIDASATDNGHGGTVVLWSDVTRADSVTNAYGTIFAKGGSNGGNGGRVETSGATLDIGGIVVNAGSQVNDTGLWLLDPIYSTIDAAAASSIQSALGSNNVTNQVAGSITVTSAINSSATHSLTLDATGGITINANMSFSGPGGGLILRADAGTVGGTGALNLQGGTTLSMAHGTQLSNNINLGDGGATITFAPLEVEYLIVGGGGGGGGVIGGGGGAGRLVTGNTTLNAGASTSVTVGAGGAGGLVISDPYGSTPGTNGSASSALGVTASGGGGGGNVDAAGAAGGSGGGAGGGGSKSGGSADTSVSGGDAEYGNAGGRPNVNVTIGYMTGSYAAAGGGGGAGGAGANGGLNYDGFVYKPYAGGGGAGRVSNITGSNVMYAAGGGGGLNTNPGYMISIGFGGSSIGGNGGYAGNPGGAGVANTGSGGGGGGNYGVGGQGGSGIVVIRYAGPAVNTTDGVITQSGNYKVHSFKTTGTSSFNLGNAFQAELTGKISGTKDLVLNAGGGTIKVSGANTYTGATTINSGVVQASHVSALGNLSAVTLASTAGTRLELLANLTVGSLAGGSGSSANLNLNNNTLTVGANDSSSSFDGKIEGSGQIVKTGTGTLTLTDNNTYSGSTTIANGSLVLENNTPTTNSSRFSGAGKLVIQPSGDDFTSNFTTAGWTFDSDLGGLTLGKATTGADGTADKSVTVASAIDISGTIEVYGGAIALNAGFGSIGIIKLKASGEINQNASGVIAAGGLALLGGDANLSSASNNVSTLAAENMGKLGFKNAGNLTIGSVNPVGINTTDTVNITVLSGNISLTEPIITTSTAVDAIVLNAGAGTAVGNVTGGNILVSGNGTVSVGEGGRATLYSGSVANSTGLTDLVESGTGHFRYNSNASTTNFNATAAALGNGTYAIYREQPTLTLSLDSSGNATIVYGDSAESAINSTAVNGDTIEQIFGNTTAPTVGMNGSTSTAGFYTVGNHSATLSGPNVTILGYAAPTYNVTSGTIEVTKANLTLSGVQVVDKVYNNSTAASFSGNASFSGVLSSSTNVSDVITLSNVSGNFSSKNVGTNLTVSLADGLLSGADAGNYNLTLPSNLMGNITAKTVSLSSSQTYSGSTTLTNVTVSTGVEGETLTYSNATAISSHVAANSTNYINAITLGDADGANATLGGLASNYQLPSLTARGDDNTANISAKQLTLTATGNISRVYDGTTNATVALSNYDLAGMVAGDTEVALTMGAASYNDAHVAAASNVSVANIAIGNITGNLSSAADDYVLSASSLTWGSGGTNGTNASITPAALTITAADKSVTYTGTTHTGWSVSYGVFQGADTAASLTGNLTYTGTSQAAVNVGTYNITAGGLSNSDYSISYVSGSLTIGKAELTVTANSKIVTYNGTEQSVGGFTAEGFVNGETVSVLTNVTAGVGGTNTGTYSSAVSGSDQNYNLTFVSGALTINKAHLTVTADDQTRTYGAANPSFTQTLTGFVNGESASTAGVTGAGVASTNATSATGVGNYTIVSSVGNLSAANYDFASSNGTLTISKAQLTVSGSKVYDGLNTLAGSMLTVSGVNGETFTAAGTVTLGTKNVQTNASLASLSGVTLTGANGALGSNYDLESVSNTSVSVTPKAVTLSAVGATKVYDGSAVKTTTEADLSSLSSQLLSGDKVTAVQMVYGDQNVGTGKRVTINSVTVADGNDGGNYQVTVADATNGVITKAALTVKVVNDAKFVTQGDTAGYGGVVYSGFVAGEDASVLSSVGSVTRSNAATNAAGTYTGVLGASGFAAANYDISYQAGTYTIVPANTLLVRAGSVSSTYGVTPTYSMSAQYLDSNGSLITALAPTGSGTFTISDGVGGAAQFELAAIDGSYSSSNNLQVGGYNLQSSNVSVTGSNFNAMVVVGSQTVTPKQLNNDMGVQSVSRVYDGSSSFLRAGMTFDASVAGVLSSDSVELVGSGSYADRHVGTNKAVTLSMALQGEDARNYVLSVRNLTGNFGAITQLSSVTYTGTSDGSWSDASNWAGGALPDGNNVATVIIPTGSTVVYDSAKLGVIGSAIANNGTIVFNSDDAFTLSNNLSGNGTVQQRGTGMLTVSGDNSALSGTIDIGAYAATLASANALGTGTVLSSGGQLSVTGTLSQLSTSGAITLMTAVNTTGDQRYNDALTFLSSGTPAASASAAVPNFYSSGGNISFMGTVSAGAGSKSAQRNLVVQADNGTVLFNDQVGQDVWLTGTDSLQTIDYANYNPANISPYAVDVQARLINLFGDVTSFESQQYRGAVQIGDNGSNGNTRLLLSLDPSISFTGAIDDVTVGQHTLMLRAMALPGSAGVPTISVQDVGLTRALAGLDLLVGTQIASSFVTDISADRNTYVGQLNLSGDVATIGDQLYVGGGIDLTNANTFRSEEGSIEMSVGTQSGAPGLTGLGDATFSFGRNAEGLGTNLAALSPSSSIDQNLLPDRNFVSEYREDIRKTYKMSVDQFVQSDSNLIADVQVGDLIEESCDPLTDDQCRRK